MEIKYQGLNISQKIKQIITDFEAFTVIQQQKVTLELFEDYSKLRKEGQNKESERLLKLYFALSDVASRDLKIWMKNN